MADASPSETCPNLTSEARASKKILRIGSVVAICFLGLFLWVGLSSDPGKSRRVSRVVIMSGLGLLAMSYATWRNFRPDPGVKLLETPELLKTYQVTHIDGRPALIALWTRDGRRESLALHSVIDNVREKAEAELKALAPHIEAAEDKRIETPPAE